MLLRLLSVLSVLVSLFGVVACSDSSPKALAPVEPVVEAAKPVVKTAGVVRFDGLPPESISGAEVLIVEALSDEAQARIKRQRELFEYKITGRSAPGVVGQGITDVSAQDAAELEAKLRELRGGLPPVAVVDVDVGNNRMRKYQSDTAMHKAYQYLFDSVKLDNLERGLKFIGNKIQEDNQALIAAGQDASDEQYQQVGATLEWLKSVQVYHSAYVQFANSYFEAKGRFEGKASDPTDFDSYAAMYAHYLIMDTSENLLGSGFAAEDGSFEVDGQGIVVVRVELGLLSVYFLPESEAETRVRIENLRVL